MSEKKPIDLQWEKKSCEHSSSFIFDLIILILAGNEDMHDSLDEFKFRPDTTVNSRIICHRAFEKLMYNVAGNEDMHESLDAFEFRLICNRVTALD